MANACSIRVQGSDVEPFRFSTTIVLEGLAAASNPLEAHYMYGEGDLAVFLEDLGIEASIILLLLSRVSRDGSAEVPVTMPAELLEVLSRHARAADRPGREV